MDFRSMKRKELQALCKEHKIAANLSNLEMANKLTEFFKEKRNSLTQGLIKGQDEIASETESTDVVVDRKVKKVRFSPEHELIEFTRSRDIKRRTRRNSVSTRDSSLSVENVDGGEMNNINVSNLGRVTRSRGLNLMESKVNDKERGRKGVKCNSQKNHVVAVENLKNGELMEDDVDKPGPVMQFRGKISVDGVKKASKRGRKGAKDDDKTEKKALDNANNEKLIEEIVDTPGRLTRSRGKKLMEDSMRKDKRRKVAENNDNAALVNAETDDNTEVSRGLGEIVNINEKMWKEEALENKKIGGVHVMVEPQLLLRRSRRNINRVGDSEILNDDTRIHENDEKKGMRKTPKLLAAEEGSGVDAKSTGSKVDHGGIALQIEEPLKRGLRRSNRRKDANVAHENLENGELKEETGNGYPLRSSIPQLGNAAEVSKDDKKVLKPNGVVRRSTRRTSSFELVSGDETINTDASMENFETENHLGNAAQKNTRRSRRNASKNNSVEILAKFGVDSAIQQKNEARKRKGGPMSGGNDVTKTNNDSSSVTQSIRKESRSEKPAPAAATGVSDTREPPSGLKEPNMLDASSRKNLLEIGESFVDAKFSVSEGAESINNTGLSNDANVDTIVSDLRLTSSRKIHRKKQDISVADSAGNADTRLINSNELANSDENAACRIAELKTDHTGNEKQISASKLKGEDNIHSSLEFDVKKLVEENISDMGKNDTAAQVFSPTEDSSCDNTMDNQVLLEGSIVSGNACFTETSYSAYSLLSADLEVAEAEADKLAQPNLEEVDGEVKCVSVQEILEPVETRCTTAIGSPITCHNNDVDHLESSDNISGSNIVDTSLKAVEAGAFASCDGHIESTDSKSALELKEPLLGMPRRSLEGDNTAEGVEIYSHKAIDPEAAENDEGGCLRDHETASNEDSEFYVPELYGERSTSIISQERGHAVINSDENNYEDISPKAGEAGAFESRDHIKSTDLKGALQLVEQSSGNLRRSLEGDNRAEGDEIYSHEGIDSEVAENHEAASNKDSESSVPRIIPQDRVHAVISSDENNKEETSYKAGEVDASDSCDGQIRSTDLKSALHLEEPSSGKLTRSLEGDNTAEGDQIYSHKGIDSEVAENGEGGWLRNHETASNEKSESSSVPRIIPQDRGHAVVSSDENNKEDTSPQTGEVGAFPTCDEYIESTDLKSALQLGEPSSGKLTRSLVGDNIAEGDQIHSRKGIDSNVAGNDDGRHLRDLETASNEDSEFIVPELFGEVSARIIPQDGGHAVMNADEHRMYNDALAVSPITISRYTSEMNMTRSHSARHIAKTDETYNSSVHSEFVETDEDGTSRHHNSKCDEGAEFGVSNLFAAERSARIMPQDKVVISCEKSIKDFDKKGMLQDSPSEAPTTMCNCAEIKLRRDHEADQIARGETYIQSELGEADEGGCLKDQMSMKDEDWLFGISDLFNAERSAPSMPQGGSSLHEISPSKPNSVFESKDCSAAYTIQGREVAIFQSKIMDETISDGECKPFDQADAHSNKDTYEPASEQPISPVADSIQGQEVWSNGSETARHAMAMFKTNGKGKSSQVAQGSNTEEDANDTNYGKDKEDFVDASITDVSVSMDYTITKIGVESLNEFKFQDIEETEHQCNSPLARHTVSNVGEESSDVSSQSWTEYELNNLFGITVDSVTPTRLNDTSCQGTEIVTLTKPVNNSVASSASSLTKKKKKLMVERGSEHAKTTNRNVVLQPDYEEASDIGFCLGSEENELKLLFATPIKIVTLCKVDETSAHEENLDNDAMFKDCVVTMKENVVTQIKSDEKVGESGNEFGYSLSVGNSLPHNGVDVTSEELEQVEGVELINNCTTPALSGGEYDGCEASKEQLTENTCECMRGTNFITEENEEGKIISLGQSCLHEEATDNHSEGTHEDIISSSGALKNLDKVEGCNDLLMDTELSENLSCESRSYLKSEGELAQSSELAVELSDAGFHKSSIPENSHCGYVDGNISRETSIDNSRGPMDAEVANIGSFDSGKYVINKGTSTSLFPKASYDDDEVAERKDANPIRVDDDPYHDISDTQDETDNPSSSHDISDELHANSEAVSVSYTPSQEAHELQSTIELHYKETNLTGITTRNADNMVPAAEHGSSVCDAGSDILSSMAMHLLLGDNENGDIEKSETRMPLLNLEDDAEKNGKEVEVQLEEKFVDSNNDIHTISDASASRCNDILKESDVADTIQEYIDSESSLSMDFEDSGASLPIDALAHIADEKSTYENAALYESKEAIDGEPSVESLEAESKKLDESILLMKLAPGSEEAVKSSPACVDLLVKGSTADKPSVETKGSAVTDTFVISKEIETSSKQLRSTPKKNARTILIHGTPRKPLTTAGMKENAPMHKSSNTGSFTTVRPAKRKALQDVQWR